MPDPLEQLYRRLPRLDCQRRCQAACGPVLFAPVEWARVTQVSGPIAQAVSVGSLQCPLLSASGACTIYPHRPAICRLYGLVKRMRCPYGCKPSRWLSEKEARRFLKAVAAIEPGPMRSPFAQLDAFPV